jgi:hypothetical protein
MKSRSCRFGTWGRPEREVVDSCLGPEGVGSGMRGRREYTWMSGGPRRTVGGAGGMLAKCGAKRDKGGGVGA